MTNLLINCFFIPREVHGIFFPVWYIYAANEHSFIAKSVHKSARQSRHSMLLAIGGCALVFYIKHTMIGTNITNHSLKKKKVPCLDLFGNKTTCKLRHIQYVIHSSEDQFLNQNVNTSDFLSKCGKHVYAT